MVTLQPSLARVITNEEVMPDARLLWLESPRIACHTQPGQFLMVHCGGNAFLRRPLSVHRVDGDRFALLFAVVGKGTAWLAGRKPGDVVDIVGPLGNGFTLPATAQKILLVAGGIGIAPLVFLADSAAKKQKMVTLLMGASSKIKLLPLLTDGILPSNINTEKITDDGSEGFKGLVTDVITNHLDRADHIFACGPLPMYRTMSRMKALENKPVQVSLEMRMACGLGLCYSCTVKTTAGLRQVCQDGPVFHLQEIVWDE